MKPIPEIQIGSVCQLLNGRAFKPSDWTDNGLPIVRIQNLNNHKKPFNYFDGTVRERFLISDGELLFSWSGTPGTSFGAFFWNRGKAVLNQHIFRVIVDESHTSKKFFRYALNSRLNRIIAQAHGGVGLQHITKGKLEATTIPLPPLPEQRRIAAILDKADEIRRKRRQAIVLTEELLRSAFLEMFGDPVGNLMGWDVTTLGQIAEIQGGLQISMRTRSILPLEVAYLRVANVYRDHLALSKIKRMRVTGKELERVRLQTNDLLFVEGHGNPKEIGRSSVWDGSIQNCVHQNHLIRARLGPSALPTYVSAFLNSAGGRRQLQRLGKTTSGLNTISSRQLRSVSLHVPPYKIQQAYVDFGESTSRTLKTMNAALQEFDAMFDSLVQRAFRGEL